VQPFPVKISATAASLASHHAVFVETLVSQQHERRWRVASGATAPGPALEGHPRFGPKVVLMSLSSYIKQIIVFNSCLHVIWKMTIMISLLGQRHCRHVIISITKPLSTNRKNFLWIMKKLNSGAKSRKLI